MTKTKQRQNQDEKITAKELKALFIKSQAGAIMGDSVDRLAWSNLLLVEELKQKREVNEMK